MAGLLSEILGFVDRAKQSAGANLGLLFSDPREYAATLNDQAREFNRLQSLATQGDLNARRGLPVTQEQLAARRYVEQVTENVAMGFAGSTKVGKTPFELAHETAQANAVKMLGLPPNNTAMDRAKAMGFDTESFHATTKNFDAFDKSKRGSSTDYGWYGPGEYSSPNPQTASAYAMADWPNYKEGANIIPLMARDAEKIRNKHGYVTEFVTREPNQLRSRFAAFDPARVNEPDLLAAGIPLGLIAGTEIDIPKPTKKKKAK